MKPSMNNCRHPRVQHPSEHARAGYASSVYLHHRYAASTSSSNRTLAHLISTSRSSKASSLPKQYVRLENTLASRIDGSDKGNGNDEVGSGVNIASSSDKSLPSSSPPLVGYSIESSSDFSSSPSSSSGSISGSDSVMYHGDSAVGDTATGSGCSLAGSTSSACGRYSGYSDPGM
nr:hypothetical protein [Tanacetum cinerariifolium]